MIRHFPITSLFFIAFRCHKQEYLQDCLSSFTTTPTLVHFFSHRCHEYRFHRSVQQCHPVKGLACPCSSFPLGEKAPALTGLACLTIIQGQSEMQNRESHVRFRETVKFRDKYYITGRLGQYEAIRTNSSKCLTAGEVRLTTSEERRFKSKIDR